MGKPKASGNNVNKDYEQQHNFKPRPQSNYGGAQAAKERVEKQKLDEMRAKAKLEMMKPSS